MPESESQDDAVVHMPIFAPQGASYYLVEYLLELICTSIFSYYRHGNRHRLVVSTNDERAFDVLQHFRAFHGFPLELIPVSRDQTLARFEIDDEFPQDRGVESMLLSKFFALTEPLAPRVVHVDLDTLFTGPIDFGPLFRHEVTLVGHEALDGRARPLHSEQQVCDVFGVPRAFVDRPVPWINTGVFAVQGTGAARCLQEVRAFLARYRRAGLACHASDELLLNALVLRQEPWVGVIDDYDYNFCSYLLERDPAWTSRAPILHFHSIKPNRFADRDVVGGPKWQPISERLCVEIPEEGSGGERWARAVAEDRHMHLAMMLWFRACHVACTGLSLERPMPMTLQVPLATAEAELRRLADELGVDLAAVSGG